MRPKSTMFNAAMTTRKAARMAMASMAGSQNHYDIVDSRACNARQAQIHQP
jgi:hypothetical protein